MSINLGPEKLKIKTIESCERRIERLQTLCKYYWEQFQLFKVTDDLIISNKYFKELVRMQRYYNILLKNQCYELKNS